MKSRIFTNQREISFRLLAQYFENFQNVPHNPKMSHRKFCAISFIKSLERIFCLKA
eukprot:TRINITY_DN6234_c0_g1_i1.p1 TRINITY_DN6234_c0_g1~~TRINITY_DN6234_c0_g1_i1.p1  ORF type:complete len:56 (-),score=1.68 TRINITY_DN6234_c0_g1_i1:389-556(-)